MRVNTPTITHTAQQPVAKVKAQQPITFTSSKEKEEVATVEKKSSLKKAFILGAAAILLAVPIVLCKIPVSKIKSLQGVQDKLINFMKNTVKPTLDKLVGRVTMGNQGLNVIR